MDVISVLLAISEHFIYYPPPHTHVVIYMYVSRRLSQILYFLCLFQSKGCSLLLIMSKMNVIRHLDEQLLPIMAAESEKQ